MVRFVKRESVDNDDNQARSSPLGYFLSRHQHVFSIGSVTAKVDEVEGSEGEKMLCTGFEIKQTSNALQQSEAVRTSGSYGPSVFHQRQSTRGRRERSNLTFYLCVVKEDRRQ